MVPPPSLRKRLEAKAQAERVARGKDGVPERSLADRRQALVFACAAFLVAAVLGGSFLLWACGSSADNESAREEFTSPEVLRLLQDAEQAIRLRYNYTLALEFLRQALEMAPKHTGVRNFLGSVLLSQDKLEEAWAHFSAVFDSRTAVTRDTHFLQQYILVLHRLGKQEELQEAWPRIAATPGISWRSSLHCPERVDLELLEGATPFPDRTVPRVTRLMAEHRDKILNEFETFRSQPGWDSKRYFKPNQDNDLVQGNDGQRWTEMLLFDKGAWDPHNCNVLPTACKILRGLIEVEGILHGKRSGQVSLLKLEAGTTLVPHFGSVNWRYTAHLGLLVPDDVTMWAGNESRQYVHGEVLLIDDSFLHSVEHRGVGPRITLFANFFHPRTKPLTVDEWYAQRA